MESEITIIAIMRDALRLQCWSLEVLYFFRAFLTFYSSFTIRHPIKLNILVFSYRIHEPRTRIAQLRYLLIRHSRNLRILFSARSPCIDTRKIKPHESVDQTSPADHSKSDRMTTDIPRSLRRWV